MSKSKKKQNKQSNNITDNAEKVSAEAVKPEETVNNADAASEEAVPAEETAAEAATETAAEETVNNTDAAAEEAVPAEAVKPEETVNNADAASEEAVPAEETAAEAATETAAEETVNNTDAAIEEAVPAEETASEAAAEEAVPAEEVAAETASEEAVPAEEAAPDAAEETVPAEETATEAAAEETVSAEETAAEEAVPAEETASEAAAEETVPAEETVNNTDAAAEEAQPQKKKKPDVVSAVIRILVIAFFFIALGMLAKTLYGYVNDIETNKQLQKEFIDTEEPVISERPKRETPKYPGIMKPVATYPKIINREKMEQLKSLNNDYYMWFFIEGTDISYPVMYSGDNSKYLKKDFYEQSNVSGTLFLDFRNREIGGNTIVYGHNMKNGTMFGELKKYNEELFFKKHTKIYTYLYDKKEVIEWTIFSAYPTNTKDRYITTAFDAPADYYEFIKLRQEKSLFATDIVLNEKDDILTLSTCRDSATEGDSGRFVVHAVKTATYPLA